MAKRSKSKNQQRHARRRAMERFGIDLDQNARCSILSQIQNGRSILVRRQSNRVVVHEVTVDSTTMHVVYDKIRKEIVTVLPVEWAEVLPGETQEED